MVGTQFRGCKLTAGYGSPKLRFGHSNFHKGKYEPDHILVLFDRFLPPKAETPKKAADAKETDEPSLFELWATKKL